MSPDIAGTEDHPHARVSLAAALATGPSHAYLFHGPEGVGKREVARAFAAELLAEGEADPDAARLRVLHGTHPDLTWVKPTGAAQMRVDDIETAVVQAATRTPFESARRVFVLERADEMNDTVANRLLKTLEEPAPFVHIILITNALGQVMPTVVSRCQAVRFDPLPPARIAERLEAAGVPAGRAAACARLALGNAERAAFLASDEGEAVRVEVDRMVDAALRGGSGDEAPPWMGLAARAQEQSAVAVEKVAALAKERLESEPKGRDKNALEKQFEQAAKRDGRRAETQLLDLGLTLAALNFRDLVCVAEGAPEVAFDPERAEARAAATPGRDPRRLRAAAELCETARKSLAVNVNEGLALEALGFRLARLVGSAG